MHRLIRKRLIVALAAISGLSTGLTLAGGLLSPLDAQCGGGGGGGCDYDACNLDTGNCETTTPAINCKEITEEPGCESKVC